MIANLKVKGKFLIEHYDKDGNLKGKHEINNAVVDVGLNSILDIMFHSATQITSWYIGIIDNASYSALSNSDTMSSHAGWIEFTNYSESVRQTWGAGSPSSRTITNASPATFSITGTGTLKGVFLVSNSTKSGTTGTLFATAAFASTIAVSNGDSLKVTYTVTG